MTSPEWMRAPKCMNCPYHHWSWEPHGSDSPTEPPDDEVVNTTAEPAEDYSDEVTNEQMERIRAAAGTAPLDPPAPLESEPEPVGADNTPQAVTFVRVPSLDNFMAVMVALKEITEPEFRQSGCYTAKPHAQGAETARKKEWIGFRSNPPLWLSRASQRCAVAAWDLVVAKMEDPE